MVMPRNVRPIQVVICFHRTEKKEKVLDLFLTLFHNRV